MRREAYVDGPTCAPRLQGKIGLGCPESATQGDRFADGNGVGSMPPHRPRRSPLTVAVVGVNVVLGLVVVAARLRSSRSVIVGRVLLPPCDRHRLRRHMAGWCAASRFRKPAHDLLGGRGAPSAIVEDPSDDTAGQVEADMIRQINAVVVVVTLGSSIVAQGSDQPAGARQAGYEQALRDLSDQWAKVPVTRDATVLRRIWSADFVYVEPSGRVFNKDEGIADVAKMTDKHTSAELRNLKIRFYSGGTVAVIVGDNREVGQDQDGKAFDRWSRFTNMWVMQNGSWHCVSGHVSDLPTK